MTTEADDESEPFGEIANVRLSAAVVVRGSAAAIDRWFREMRRREDLRLVYQKTSGQRLKVVVDEEERP